MSIIAISGYAGSGKDTVAAIIQYLTSKEPFSFTLQEFLTTHSYYQNNENCTWQNKKFSDKLKDIVCILLGCSRKDLEDKEFKEKELSREWDRLIPIEDSFKLEYSVQKMTPRLLIQLIRTDLFRDNLNDNIWVNSLFTDYKSSSLFKFQGGSYINNCIECGKQTYNNAKLQRICKDCCNNQIVEYPNWIISDLRFLNELKTVKDKGGISIRVNRKTELQNKQFCESEKNLDNTAFDHYINNNGNIKELVESVKKILVKENINYRK